MFRDNVVIDPWKEPGEVKEKPFKRLIIPLFGPNLRDVSELNANIVSIPSYSGTNYHNHVLGEIIFIVSGTGEALLGNERFDLHPDTIFWAPAGVFHHIRNTGKEPMKVFAVFAPGMERSNQMSQVKATDPPEETYELK